MAGLLLGMVLLAMVINLSKNSSRDFWIMFFSAIGYCDRIVITPTQVVKSFPLHVEKNIGTACVGNRRVQGLLSSKLS